MDAELTNKSRDAINAATSRAVTDGHAGPDPRASAAGAARRARTTRTSPTCWPPSTPTRPPCASGAERLLAALPSVPGSTVAPPQPNRELLAVIADAAAARQGARRRRTSPPSTC